MSGVHQPLLEFPLKRDDPRARTQIPLFLRERRKRIPFFLRDSHALFEVRDGFTFDVEADRCIAGRDVIFDDSARDCEVGYRPRWGWRRAGCDLQLLTWRLGAAARDRSIHGKVNTS